MIDFKNFQKPQRYIGNEWNVIKKSHSNNIPICLIFPDLYEIGMSNLGLRILYGLLNEFNGVVCERAFMPAPDFEEYLKAKKQKLFSLETKTTLDKFEVLGINLSYELNFPNVLHLLNIGGISLKSEERKNTIVLGGGIGNPEPLVEFIDVFFLGEFEEKAEAFVQILKKHRDKENRLKAMSEIEGFYVPKFYNHFLQKNKYVFEKKYADARIPIKKVHVKNLDNSFYPLKWLTPYTQITHDRLPVEISRGCPNRCSFCQARAQYFPYRQRSLSSIKEIIPQLYKNSGYENFSLLSLSASDYSQIEELIDSQFSYFQNKKIGLSLPSLRIDDILGRLYEKLLKIKKTSITVAIEAANKDLRDKLNKNIDVNKLFEAAKMIKSLNVQRIKTYFMFGFPQETEEDLLAIGEFLRRLNKESRLLITAGINIFIPKPFSLWENIPMQESSILDNKIKTIFKNMPRNIKVSLASIQRSIIEAVLARADRRFSAVIYRAFLKGAKLEGYKENFSWEIWQSAMREEGIDYRFYLSANTENFPWSFIS